MIGSLQGSLGHCSTLLLPPRIKVGQDPPSLFYFFAGKMLLRQIYCLSCNHNPPTAAANNPSIARPLGETPVKSGGHFSSVGTGLPRMYVRAFRLGNQLNGHTDAYIHNKLSRDVHRISSSTFDFYRLLPVLLSYIEMQKHGISISYSSKASCHCQNTAYIKLLTAQVSSLLPAGKGIQHCRTPIGMARRDLHHAIFTGADTTE